MRTDWTCAASRSGNPVGPGWMVEFQLYCKFLRSTSAWWYPIWGAAWRESWETTENQALEAPVVGPFEILVDGRRRGVCRSPDGIGGAWQGSGRNLGRQL